MKFETTVKNSIGAYGMVQEKALKSLVGKKVMVTVDEVVPIPEATKPMSAVVA